MRHCERCNAVESAFTRFEDKPRNIGSLTLPARVICEDTAACTERRLTPPQTYTQAHQAVLAARKARRLS